MTVTYFLELHKMFCKFNITRVNLTSLRFLRWIIFVPFIIYLTVFFVNYNKTLPFDIEDEEDKTFEIIKSLSFDIDYVPNAKRIDNDLSLDDFDESSIAYRYDESIREQAEIQENPKDFLEKIFRRVDTNENQLLDIMELSKWIHTKIREHIKRSMGEATGMFTAIDNNPKNDEVSWEEYHAHFLRSHGFSDNYINTHDKRHVGLPRLLKESIMRDRARWSEVAKSDPEALSINEFLTFTHPENDYRTLTQIVEDLVERFDRDGDQMLTETEFLILPYNSIGLDLDEDRGHVTFENENRRKEFRYLIDKNKDGNASYMELLYYIDPQHPRYAVREAQHLIALSDMNDDGELSLSEILNKMDLFLSSKMVNAERSIHDEF